MKKNQLEQLLKQHHKAAYFWALQLCNYQEDSAKDVLQMTYLKILENKARYNEKSGFKTWLFSVIRFTAYDHLKDQRQFRSLDGLEVVQDTSVYEVELNLKPYLEQLPERQKQVLLALHPFHPNSPLLPIPGRWNARSPFLTAVSNMEDDGALGF